MPENKDELLTACKVDTSQIDQYRRTHAALSFLIFPTSDDRPDQIVC